MHHDSPTGLARYQGHAPDVHSFADVPPEQPRVYLNSLLNIAVALNMDSFAEKQRIAAGAEWRITLQKCR